MGKVLAIVGRPVYLLFSYIFIFILLAVNITGYVVRVFVRILFLDLPLGITNSIKQKVHIKRLKISLLKLTYIVLSALKDLAGKIINVVSGFYIIGVFLVFISAEIVKKVGKFLFAKISKIKTRFQFVQLVGVLPKVKLPKVKLIIFASTLFALMLVFLGFVFWSVILSDLPQAEQLVTRKQEVSTKIYDRDGILLFNIYKDKNRTPVPLNRIPAQVRLATIAIEDAEFYNHPGISLRGIARAIIKLVREGEVTGGSTITQQLVKNALLTSERTLVRKLREIVLAMRVELTFTKDEILEMYLNEVSYGGTAYGVQEAAQVYFDKDVDQLTLSEAALLAGLPKSPTRFSPFGANPDLAIDRQYKVLRLMRINGYITPEQKETAQNEKLAFSSSTTNIKAPHFVMYVRQLLAEKYGEEVVSQEGLTVTTTLDINIQKLAEDIVKKEVESLESLNVGNGAALVLDTKTGEILAMVGSFDYFDIEADGNVNLTTAPRQPGSSIKVVNYSYALSNGYSPTTILEDTAKTFNIDGQPPYTPKNYDGQFRGNLTLRNAFAESRNVPAVKVLNSYGVGNMIKQGRKMGITTWTDPSNYGLSLTLGGGEVKLLDLAQVYATIANYGQRPKITSLLKVTNYEGEVLEKNVCEVNTNPTLVAQVTADENLLYCEREQVLDPRVAFQIIDILSDNQARSPSFGSNSLLVIPGHSEVAVKTGTSNDLRDNLTIGFNQKYLVAIWVGNNDNSPMGRVASGITGATPIWNKIMSSLLAGEETLEWPVPEKLVQLPICSLTNSLACEGCLTAMEWFLEENKPALACNPEYIEYIKKQNGLDDKKTDGLLPEEAIN